MTTKPTKATPKTLGPILFCGDPHGRLEHIVRTARERHASAVILLGDIEPPGMLHETIAPIRDITWYIHGNHDTDTDANWRHLWESQMADRNIHGRVITLPDGSRLAGLGGVFRAAVWHPDPGSDDRGKVNFRNRKEHEKATPRQDRWQGSVHRKHWSTIYPEELDKMADLRADILITHEAPGYHRNGFEILDTLAQSMGVQVTVHGHHHDNLDSSARWQAQGFRSYGVGLRGITAIDINGPVEVLVQGELDAHRAHRQDFVSPSP